MPPRKVAPVEDIEVIEGEVEEEPTNGLAVIPSDPQHYVVAGMGTLAAMTDEEYDRRKAIMKKGQERVKDLQMTLMQKGEDYGNVAGIKRPFLHLPGAEKLASFYGLAVRQEVERIDGTRQVKAIDGMAVEAGDWATPPLSYHVRSYVHVGSFDGPAVAMGYGEANSWEEKYRWRFAKAKCPACGREGLIKGKPDGKLAGKWWCPTREGGCNRTFEPDAKGIEVPGKVENTDPYSLAETLIQMAGKRSFVAAIRRATGTSGLFTQDEDSPSVRQQAGTEASDTEEVPPPVYESAPEVKVAPGGKSATPTPEQITRLRKISTEKDLGPDKIADVIERVTGVAPKLEGDRRAKGIALLAFIQSTISADVLGQVLMALDTGEVPAKAEEAAFPGEDDAVAVATYDEDLGAH